MNLVNHVIVGLVTLELQQLTKEAIEQTTKSNVFAKLIFWQSQELLKAID